MSPAEMAAETLPPPSMATDLRQCARCGTVHSEADWAANPTRRDWVFPDEVLEIAECGCGNTLSKAVTR